MGELKEANFFELVLENAPIHIIVTDSEGNVVYVNPAAEKITGYSRNEMIGKKPNLWGGQMEEDFYREMWHTIKVRKETFVSKIVNKRKDGTKYMATILIKPILEDGWNVKGFIGIEQDVTDTEKTKEVLNLYKNEFKKISELTVGSESELEKLKQKIEKLERALSEILR